MLDNEAVLTSNLSSHETGGERTVFKGRNIHRKQTLLVINEMHTERTVIYHFHPIN